MALALWGSVGLCCRRGDPDRRGARGVLLLYSSSRTSCAAGGRDSKPGVSCNLGFLPTGLFDSLTRGALYYPDELARINEQRAATGGQPLILPDFRAVVCVTAAWVTAFVGAAFAITRKRDL